MAAQTRRGTPSSPSHHQIGGKGDCYRPASLASFKPSGVAMSSYLDEPGQGTTVEALSAAARPSDVAVRRRTAVEPQPRGSGDRARSSGTIPHVRAGRRDGRRSSAMAVLEGRQCRGRRCSCVLQARQAICSSPDVVMPGRSVDNRTLAISARGVAAGERYLT